MNREKKVDFKEIGLNIGTVLASYFLKTEHMHYGYWVDDLKVENDNFAQAQKNYLELLISHMPKGTQTILDVGCGVGKNAEELTEAGYKVDCVSPSLYLSEKARERLGEQSQIYDCCYEDIQTEKKYDVIMFSESFQYIDVNDAMNISTKLLKEGGHILICDFFRKDVEGKSPIGGGHNLRKFYQLAEKLPYNKITDLDITKETAPSLDLMNDIIMQVVYPIWNSIAYYMQVNYPKFSRIFSWKFRAKIEKMHRKYFSQSTNAKSFMQFKSYHLMLFQKK